MVIVDSTVWVDYLNGVKNAQTNWLDGAAGHQPVALLDLIACEILQGLASDAEAGRVLRHLRRFEIFDTGGIELAAAAASNYRFLRGRGRTVRKTIDCLIASYCLLHDQSLLHNDRDFDAFEDELGLRVLHP